MFRGGAQTAGKRGAVLKAITNFFRYQKSSIMDNE
jgi:hypothetical protein